MAGFMIGLAGAVGGAGSCRGFLAGCLGEVDGSWHSHRWLGAKQCRTSAALLISQNDLLPFPCVLVKCGRSTGPVSSICPRAPG